MKNILTAELRDIALSGLFVAIGQQPKTAPFAAAIDVDSNGYFVPLAGSSAKTNVPSVYVAGDCADETIQA